MSERTMESLLAIEPAAKQQKVYVGEGVYLCVLPSGTRTWRLKFRLGGKERLKSIGRFPDMSETTAKQVAFDLRSMLKQSGETDLVRALAYVEMKGDYVSKSRLQATATFEQRVQAVLDLPTDADTFVYFVRTLEMDCVKIGYTHDVPARIAALQVGQPYTLEVMATVPGGPRHEGLLHSAFNPERIRGEWFRLSPRLQSFIKNL